MLRYLWVLPFLLLLYVYGSEALGVFQGDAEHYQILSGLGLSGSLTSLLVWLSVVIEAAIIASVLWKPSQLTYSIAALWPWVPRILTAVTGGELEVMEIGMSLLASASAVSACLAYERFRTDPAATRSAAAAGTGAG